MTDQEFFNKVKLDLEKLNSKLPTKDLLDIVDFINNYSKIRPSVEHSLSNGYLKSSVYEVISYNKIKRHFIIGTFSNYKDAMRYSIERCLDIINCAK